MVVCARVRVYVCVYMRVCVYAAWQVKALFRRAQAQGDDNLKLRDLSDAIAMDPDNKAVAAEMKRIKEKDAKQLAAEKRAYAKMFA